MSLLDLPTYLDVKTVVQLKRLSEQEDELEKVGKLPHIPYAMEYGWLLGRLRIVAGVALLEGPLARCRHRDDRNQL